MKLSIIIPSYNEEGAIKAVLESINNVLNSYSFQYQVIVVDDGSQDNSVAIAQSVPNVTVIQHTTNKGNSSAVLTGINASCGEFVLTMDADGQHDPAELPKLIDTMDNYDMVVGARGKSYKTTLGRKTYQIILRTIASFVTGSKIPDINTGFRVMRKSTLDEFMYLWPKGFSYNVTTTVAFLYAEKDVLFREVIMHQRQSGVSKIRPFKDGIRLSIIVFRIMNLFEPLKFYIPSGLFALFASTAWAIYKYTNDWNGIPALSISLLTLGIILIFFGFIIDQVVKSRREMNQNFVKIKRQIDAL